MVAQPRHIECHCDLEHDSGLSHNASCIVAVTLGVILAVTLAVTLTVTLAVTLAVALAVALKLQSGKRAVSIG